MGDAGCVTGSKQLMDRVRMYRDHGRIGRYDIVEPGYNARIDNMQSNVVLAKLPKLNAWVNRKRQICNYYTQELSPYVKTPTTEPGNTYSYYVYVVQTPERDALQKHLNSAGIQTNIHYATTTHLQPAFKPWSTPCPVAEKIVTEILSLPCWYSMSDDQLQYVVDNVKGFFK